MSTDAAGASNRRPLTGVRCCTNQQRQKHVNHLSSFASRTGTKLLNGRSRLNSTTSWGRYRPAGGEDMNCCTLMQAPKSSKPQLIYFGPMPPCIASAFCSWKRSPNRVAPFIYLSTHRNTQPSSREIRDLVVKSLTQSSKHRWTRLEYVCDS